MDAHIIKSPLPANGSMTSTFLGIDKPFSIYSARLVKNLPYCFFKLGSHLLTELLSLLILAIMEIKFWFTLNFLINLEGNIIKKWLEEEVGIHSIKEKKVLSTKNTVALSIVSKGTFGNSFCIKTARLLLIGKNWFL